MADRNKVLVVFCDALGPDQLERFGTLLEGLPYRKSLDGILGYSSGALASVLTGAPPSHHGRMCLFSQRPADTASVLEPLKWLGLLPRALHERGRLRHHAGKLFAKAAGLTGYVALHRVPPEHFHWLDLPEKEDIFQANAIGGVRTFLSDAREAGLSVYASPWQVPEPRRWSEALSAITRLKPDLAFLYAAELDAALHLGGNAGPQAEAAIQRIAERVNRARERMLETGGRLTTLLIGDHGMADVREVIDPRPMLSTLTTRVFVDSTMMRFWGDGAALAHARRLAESANWPGRWLDHASLQEREVPLENAPFGNAMFLLSEGTLFAPSFAGGRIAGMHGYDMHTRSAKAALASDAPIPEGCDSIAGVARVVRERLDLAP